MSRAPFPSTLLDQACLPYQAHGRFAWHFARGKLSGDPVFAEVLRRGLFPSGAQVLDIGCGQGLLAALLGSLDGHSAAERDWPADWAAAPVGVRVHGIDLHGRDVQLAQSALAHLGQRARFTQADMRQMAFESADVVVILDVLHYVDHDAQDDVLRRAHAALPAGGVLLLRVGDAAAGWPYRFSVLVDMVVVALRSARLARLHGRRLSDWEQRLTTLGFAVETRPMHAGTPFANHLLVARKRAIEPR